jgi:hypothetical protein
MVGLDAAGKTTILYKLKLGEIVTTIPTIGETRTRPSMSSPNDSDFTRLQRRNSRVQEHILHRYGFRSIFALSSLTFYSVWDVGGPYLQQLN